METKTLNKYKKWFKSKGYEFTDEFWMEDYITDHKFIDIIKLIDNYVSEQTETQEREKATLNIGSVSERFMYVVTDYDNDIVYATFDYEKANIKMAELSKNYAGYTIDKLVID